MRPGDPDPGRLGAQLSRAGEWSQLVGALGLVAGIAGPLGAAGYLGASALPYLVLRNLDRRLWLLGPLGAGTMALLGDNLAVALAGGVAVGLGGTAKARPPAALGGIFSVGWSGIAGAALAVGSIGLNSSAPLVLAAILLVAAGLAKEAHPAAGLEINVGTAGVVGIMFALALRSWEIPLGSASLLTLMWALGAASGRGIAVVADRRAAIAAPFAAAALVGIAGVAGGGFVAAVWFGLATMVGIAGDWWSSDGWRTGGRAVTTASLTAGLIATVFLGLEALTLLLATGLLLSGAVGLATAATTRHRRPSEPQPSPDYTLPVRVVDPRSEGLVLAPEPAAADDIERRAVAMVSAALEEARSIRRKALERLEGAKAAREQRMRLEDHVSELGQLLRRLQG